MRQLVLLTIVVCALVALVWAQPGSPAAADQPTLAYVTTAHQLGVVSYRDPLGAISPDGKLFAYTEGRFIRVVPIGGGAPITLAPGEGQIRHLTWLSNDTVVAEDFTPTARWWTFRVGSTERQPLWSGTPIATNGLRQLTFSLDGKQAAALATTREGTEVWRIAADATSVDRQRLTGRVSFPAFTPSGEIACIVDARLTIPCGGAKKVFAPDQDVYGPVAFVRDAVYFASPNDRGMVELWSADLATRRSKRVSIFARDAYAPSITTEGTLVFKTQSYRTFVADAPATGGSTRQLAAFQSETPSYHPTRPLIAFTYGTWRRVIDDAKYPDIAQDIGVIDLSTVPAAAPASIIAKSDSEDQAMAWSPNGKWIAFHTHREMSDDVWLRPADGSQPDKRITFLGRGAEVGWPRWSQDGKNVLLEGARKSDGRSVMYVIGVDQNSGATTSELREIRTENFDAGISHGEWLGNNSVIAVAKEGPGRHVIITLPVAGGAARIVHRYATEHDFSGLGASSDGKFVAFAAPAPDGFYQIFKKAIDGNTPAVQLTSDPSNKTQPAFSPDGARIAFTVWSYDATFWSFSVR